MLSLSKTRFSPLFSPIEIVVVILTLCLLPYLLKDPLELRQRTLTRSFDDTAAEILSAR